MRSESLGRDAHRIASEVFKLVFELLDSEPKIDGYSAGRVATVAEHVTCQMLLGAFESIDHFTEMD